MKVACFAILVLLVAALVNAAPSDVHKATSSLPSGMVKGIRGFLAKAGGTWHTAKTDQVVSRVHQINTTRLRVHAGTKKDIPANKACISHEHCKKNRVICSKKCSRPRGEISKKHIPRSRCVVKCRKCVPSC